MSCINTAGDLPQIRRSTRSWHTKTVRQMQRMNLVTSPWVLGVWKDKRGANNPCSETYVKGYQRFSTDKFYSLLLNVIFWARPDADLYLEVIPAHSQVPRTRSWNHIPNLQATHSCVTEALVTTSVEEHRLTSVYWFPTGFDLSVKAINKCEAATISCAGEVSHYWTEGFKLQWEWLSETGAVYRWGSAHYTKQEHLWMLMH